MDASTLVPQKRACNSKWTGLSDSHLVLRSQCGQGAADSRRRVCARAKMNWGNPAAPWCLGAVRWKIEDPVVGSTGPSTQFESWDNPSGRLRCSLLGNALCLRAFLSLHDFEFNIIALLEALVSLRLDGTVVDEHIGSIITADKAEALCVIEPFHFTFNSRHVPYSGLSLGTR